MKRIALLLVLVCCFVTQSWGHPYTQSELDTIAAKENVIATANANNATIFEYIDYLELLIFLEEQETYPNYPMINFWNAMIDIEWGHIAENNADKIAAVNAINAVHTSHNQGH